MDLGHLAHLIRRADGVFYDLEHPAGDGVPGVIRAVHEDEDGYLLVQDEEAGEYGFAFAGEGIPPVDIMDIDGREDELDEDIGRPMDMDDQEDEDTDDSSDWTDGSDVEGEDSGYDSMYKEDEEEKEEGEDQDLGPRSPLVQQLPPDHFWQAWRQEYPPVPTGPPVPAHPPAGPPVPPSAPSTSGLGPSTKRIREESDAAQDSAKKQRRDYEDMDDEQPSTSGLNSSTLRRYFQAPLDDSDSD